LCHHSRIEACRQTVGLRHLAPVRHLGDAHGRTFVRRLDYQWHTESIYSLVKMLLTKQHHVVRGRQPLVQPHFFCHHLVHRQAGCHGPATCVRQLHEFKHSLKGSVLAISTVQGNKHSVKTSVDQVDERMGASVEQV